MATYFHSNSEFQGAAADGLQTLIFMNPAYNHPPPPTIFLNSNSKQHFSPPPPQDVSAFLYNLPVAKQGLSLTLSSHHPPGFQSDGGSPPPESALLTSKYLKAAQELLDEVVKVGQSRNTANSSATAGEDTVKGELHLTTAERQEIQMKKAKLVNMLDEVEQRYRQYHHQMQIVIAWFERAAGIGSAKSYTDLALQTISKQFRCLKDAILAQIRAATKSLGEDDIKMDGSRLKYVDNQIRQQRALQQLGMIQNNAWRPQRGLPERSVSVLRAWLFEHFLHPYPKDSDKLMLAKQTGLTRSQVSNWFINARVRLWKPMVEEMYMEEMKEHGSETSDHNEDPKSPAPELDNDNQMSPKKLRNSPEMLHSPSTDNEHISMGFTLMGAPTNFVGGFGSYPIGELGSNQFQAPPPPYSGNGVSLTLGLPHCENMSMSGGHQSFQRVVIGEANDFNGHVYDHDGINIQNRKRFGAAAQLLPDFVA